MSAPRFEVINKYNVAIKSLRNQLKHATGIDELTNIASKIIDLENQILIEKSTGYKQLEKEKSKIEAKIIRLQREMDKASRDLNNITNSLDFKLNGYKKTLQDKIDSLNEEYQLLLGFLNEK